MIDPLATPLKRPTPPPGAPRLDDCPRCEQPREWYYCQSAHEAGLPPTSVTHMYLCSCGVKKVEIAQTIRLKLSELPGRNPVDTPPLPLPRLLA